MVSGLIALLLARDFQREGDTGVAVFFYCFAILSFAIAAIEKLPL